MSAPLELPPPRPINTSAKPLELAVASISHRSCWLLLPHVVCAIVSTVRHRRVPVPAAEFPASELHVPSPELWSLRCSPSSKYATLCRSVVHRAYAAFARTNVVMLLLCTFLPYLVVSCLALFLRRRRSEPVVPASPEFAVLCSR